MFTKLLVPLDRSSFAEQALGPAAAIARAAGAKIDLLLVHQHAVLESFSDEADARLWSEEHEYLEGIGRELASGGDIETSHGVIKGRAVEGSATEGSVVAAIHQRALAVDAQLIVMTSHGRTGLSRSWLGSVADGVVRHSSVPVLVLPPTQGDVPRADRHLPSHLLVLVDMAEASEAILPAAAALATAANARVTLLHVVQPSTIIAPAGVPFAYSSAILPDESTPTLVSKAETRLADIQCELTERFGLRVATKVIVNGFVASAVLDFARGHDVDLIAMTTHGRGVSRLLVGSVADKVLRGSGLPVMLLRPRATTESAKLRMQSHEVVQV